MHSTGWGINPQTAHPLQYQGCWSAPTAVTASTAPLPSMERGPHAVFCTAFGWAAPMKGLMRSVFFWDSTHQESHHALWGRKFTSTPKPGTERCTETRADLKAETRRSAYLHTSVFRSMYSNCHGSSLGVSYWGCELWTEVQHFTNTDTGFKGLPTIMLIWCFPESWALKTTNLKFYSSFFWILPFFCFTCLGKQLKAHQCEAPSTWPSEALLKQHCPTMLTAQTPSAPLTVQLCTTFTWLSPGTLPSNDKI